MARVKIEETRDKFEATYNSITEIIDGDKAKIDRIL